MSKKKTDMEMREIAERIKNMVKDWNEDDWDDLNEEEAEDEENEEEDYRHPECECVDGECDQCEHWVYNDCCELDDEGEDCEEEEEDIYGGDCENCKYWNWSELCCELNNNSSNNDKDMCNDSKEHTQIEELSKFIMSVNTVLGSDMGLLVFDKSNKKDMGKIAAIFGEYAKKL